MNTTELWEFLKSGKPVSYQEITYEYISAIIFRKHKGITIKQVELKDKNKNSVTIARGELVLAKE